MPGFTLADLTQAVDSRKRMYGNIIRGLLDDPGATLAQLAAVDSENAKANRLRGGGLLSVMPEVRDQAQQESVQQALNLGGLLGMIAYHGSPHTFDKFDMSKIGTGEGAQAYGHGLYFAENPGVAKQYQDALASDAVAYKGRTAVPKPGSVADVALAHLSSAPNDVNPYAWAGRSVREVQAAATDANKPFFDKVYDALAKMQEKGVAAGKSGTTYKVDIPDDAVAKMLDWDKPLSQQPHLVDIVQKVRPGYMTGGLPKSGITGADAYLALEESVGKAKASQIFRDAGIPGIRYLDAGSRGKGGTYNFVLFDDQLPKIIGRE